jgi:hypothetical protein
MKGYVPVEIPTKAYLKAWVHLELGEKPVMSQKHHIGSKLLDLLIHKRNYKQTEYKPHHYPVLMRVLINKHAFKNQGCNLNQTNIIKFNTYIESYFKSKMHWKLDFYMKVTQSVEASIELMRDDLGLDEENFPFDMIKQDYYRYRKEKGIVLPKGGYKKRAYTNIQVIL